jgi:membrane protein
MVEDGFARVEQISFTALGGTGLVLLLWMVISVLGRVEGAFNTVWGVTAGRSVWRRFTDYLSILVVLPVLIAAASSVPAVDLVMRLLDEPGAALVRRLLESAPLKAATVLATTGLCFTFVLMFMPNTRVRTRSGLAGGFVTALLFLAWMRFCAAVQVGVASRGRIYGSFAVVPIVLFWVYVSWQIILFGAEVAFAVQNCGTYRMEAGAGKASFRARSMVALSIVVAAARGMLGQSGRFDVAAYAREKRIPVRLLNDVIADLERLGLIAAVADDEGTYALLRSPDALLVVDVLESLSDAGVQGAALGLDRIDAPVRRAVESFHREGHAALAKQTVHALAVPAA